MKKEKDTKNCGIYEIRNLVNGKRYIGQSRKLDKRWREHRRGLKNSSHFNPHLQRAWVKYGAENFEFSVLRYCSPEKTGYHEARLIKKHKTHDRRYGYNIEIPTEKSLGHSEESKQKMSENMKGEKNHQWGKKGEDSPRYGTKHSEKAKIKMLKAKKGKKLSKEHKKKISKALCGAKHPFYGIRGRDHPNYGKKHTEDVRKGMSENRMGKKNPFYGKKHSKETKKIISEKSKKNWEIKKQKRGNI